MAKKKSKSKEKDKDKKKKKKKKKKKDYWKYLNYLSTLKWDLLKSI